MSDRHGPMPSIAGSPDAWSTDDEHRWLAGSGAASSTVFVIDDDPSIRDLLRALLESVGLVVEAFASGAEFFAALHPARAGCVVCDVRMPGMSGLDVQDQLQARKLSLPIIILTAYADVSMAVHAMRGGAVDVMEKPFHRQTLLDRVHDAIEVDRRRRLLDAQRRSVAARVGRLTPREREVMALVVAGKPNKVIATDLGLGAKTVEVHRAHVMRKMEADSLAELVRLTILVHGE